MYKALLIVGLNGLVGCGTSGSSGNSPGPTENPQSKRQGITKLVADDSSLSPCVADNESELVYVLAAKTFKVCTSTVWTAIDLSGAAGKDGAAGAAGSSTASSPTVTTLPVSSTDLCTEQAQEFCYFKGGSKLAFADGTVLITGSFLYKTTTVSPDYYDITGFTIVSKVTDTLAYTTMTHYINLPAGQDSNIYTFTSFASYDRTAGTFKIWHDLNNNGTLESASDLELIAITPQ